MRVRDTHSVDARETGGSQADTDIRLRATAMEDCSRNGEVGAGRKTPKIRVHGEYSRMHMGYTQLGLIFLLSTKKTKQKQNP